MERLAASVRPKCSCSFFIFPIGWYGCVQRKFRSGVRETQNPSLMFSGDRNIPTQEPTISVGNEACQVSLLTVDPNDGIFLEPLNSNDRLFFSHAIYTVCKLK